MRGRYHAINWKLKIHLLPQACDHYTIWRRSEHTYTSLPPGDFPIIWTDTLHTHSINTFFFLAIFLRSLLVQLHQKFTGSQSDCILEVKQQHVVFISERKYNSFYSLNKPSVGVTGIYCAEWQQDMPIVRVTLNSSAHVLHTLWVWFDTISYFCDSGVQTGGMHYIKLNNRD